MAVSWIKRAGKPDPAIAARVIVPPTVHPKVERPETFAAHWRATLDEDEHYVYAIAL